MSRKHLFAKNYQSNIEGIIRVDYAGEKGAVKIYSNQIKALPNNEHLTQMLDSEIVHFEYFKELSKKLSVRQSLMLPLWSRLASLMGYTTAKHSSSMAMLCTQAVETVIEKHYLEQIQEITDILEYSNKKDPYITQNKKEIEDLLAKIKILMQEETEHKTTGEEHSEMKPLPFFIMKAITKLAVIISEKV